MKAQEITLPRTLIIDILHFAQAAKGKETAGYIQKGNSKDWICSELKPDFFSENTLSGTTIPAHPRSQMFALFHAPALAAPSNTPPPWANEHLQAGELFLQIRREVKGVLEIFPFIKTNKGLNPCLLTLSENK